MMLHCRCDQCVGLRRRVRQLEQELGEQKSNQLIAAICGIYTVAPRVGRMIALLYNAKGALVSRERLANHVLTRDAGEEAIKTYVHRVRSVMGEDAIETQAGLGYRMSAAGLAQLDAHLDANNPVRGVTKS